VGAALARFRPDAVIIHGYAQMTMLRALFWCRLRGARAILTSDSSTHGAPPGLRRAVKQAALPSLLRQFGAALTMSDRNEAHLANLRYPRRRMFRMPMMIDEGFWAARARRGPLRAAKRAALGLDADEFVLLAVGKLAARKRIFDILHALSMMNAGRMTLLLAGDGEQRGELQALADGLGLRVRILGFVNIDALPEIYSAADALVHAAQGEQYGMVALEAAIMGLPLILSDETGAIGETSIARAGANALVFRCGDIAALAQAIAQLRDDMGSRRKLAEASEHISLDHAGAKSVAAVLKAIAK
jgi:glycosyltransferase involved in cell wall biosynthesis